MIKVGPRREVESSEETAAEARPGTGAEAGVKAEPPASITPACDVTCGRREPASGFLHDQVVPEGGEQVLPHGLVVLPQLARRTGYRALAQVGADGRLALPRERLLLQPPPQELPAQVF